MVELFQLILGVLASLFKSRARLEAENLVLRQQVNVLRRQAPKRPQLNNTDRCLVVWLYRCCPSVFGAIAIVRPETIIRWHRARFRAYWRWRSRNRVGRPRISAELRKLIGEMSRANRLWGAPHIQGELLKLGFTRFFGGANELLDGRVRWGRAADFLRGLLILLLRHLVVLPPHFGLVCHESPQLALSRHIAILPHSR